MPKCVSPNQYRCVESGPETSTRFDWLAETAGRLPITESTRSMAAEPRQSNLYLDGQGRLTHHRRELVPEARGNHMRGEQFYTAWVGPFPE
jgi:hypothetical protein